MKRKYNDKMVSEAKEETKVPEINLQKADGPFKICIRECNIPFVGYWKAGTLVGDPDVLAKIGDNPNFKDHGGTQS